MSEREGFKEKAGRALAVSVLVPAASVNFGHVQPAGLLLDHLDVGQTTATHRFMESLPSVEASQDLSFFGQFDNYLERSYGRALASAAVVGTLALLWSARRINRETDSESQEKLAIFSSVVAISFASVLLAESFVDVDSKVPASLFEAFMVTQTALNFWRVAQRNRNLDKRSAALLMSLSMITISTIPLAETLR